MILCLPYFLTVPYYPQFQENEMLLCKNQYESDLISNVFWKSSRYLNEIFFSIENFYGMFKLMFFFTFKLNNMLIVMFIIQKSVNSLHF